jgi:hypothetical protein
MDNSVLLKALERITPARVVLFLSGYCRLRAWFIIYRPLRSIHGYAAGVSHRLVVLGL